jgi:predicted amidohydrolase
MNAPHANPDGGGRLIDPANKVDAIGDVLDGRVLASDAEAQGVTARREIDAGGAIVCPCITRSLHLGNGNMKVAAQ